MKIDFDPAKNERNIAERQLSFEMVSDFDWESAIVDEDLRQTYPKRRFVALGL